MNKNTFEDYLAEVNYSFKGYVPSEAALKFASFIAMVNGGTPENKTPIVHLKLFDSIFDRKRNSAIVCARGMAKSSILEYLALYIMGFGEMPNGEKINFLMYISDSIENGVKSFRKNIEHRYNNSDFLQKLIPMGNIKYFDGEATPGARFTDVRIETVNVRGNNVAIRMFGVKTGVRGTKEFGRRPQLCHKKGTVVTTDVGKHLVEEYPKQGIPRKEIGYSVSLYGLTDIEDVTPEHRYWVKPLRKKRVKKYLQESKTLSYTEYFEEEECWVEAKELARNKLLGNQQHISHYLCSPINRTEKVELPELEYFSEKITERDAGGRIVSHKPYISPKINPKMALNEFAWVYGLYLADGTVSYPNVTFYINDNQKNSVYKKLQESCSILGYSLSGFYQRRGCFSVSFTDAVLSRYLKKNHLGNSRKLLEDFALQMPLEWQRQLLLGYIAGDSYIDYKQNQVRINSVNKDIIEKLGVIAARLGMPYHIRYGRAKEIISEFKDSGITSIGKKQWELRLRDNVKKVLGFNIKDNPLVFKEVFIKGDYLYRKVKKVSKNKLPSEYIPIQTPTHTYLTSFGISHNCLIDDVLSDEDARSETVIKSINDTIHKAVRYALDPKKNKMIWVGTPFNSKDPLYTVVESGAWNVSMFPICEKFPCEREEFKGAWEDRFDYDFVKSAYDNALALGQIDSFNQELMLRIISKEDTLIPRENLVYFKRDEVVKNKGRYNFYITTDLATSIKKAADYSVISVWAYSNNGDYMLVDGWCKRAEVSDFINMLFHYVSRYNPLGVGLEVTGQQGGFISWVREEMIKKNIYFNFLSSNNDNNDGIRPVKDKFERFVLFKPRFMAKKIWIAQEMVDTAWHNEFIEELDKATTKGFKSKHDDILDTISMLGSFEAYAPSGGSGNTKDFIKEIPKIKNTIF